MSTRGPSSDDEPRKGSAVIDSAVIKMLCPFYSVGAIIGKNGENIKQIKDKVTAHIDVSKNDIKFPGTEERIVTIQGDAKSMREVIQFVQDKIRNDSKAKQSDTNDKRKKCCKLVVADTSAGRVIGKAGENVKAIKDKYRVRINTSKKGETPDDLDERVISIEGDNDNVDKCIDEMLEMIVGDPRAVMDRNVNYMKYQHFIPDRGDTRDGGKGRSSYGGSTGGPGYGSTPGMPPGSYPPGSYPPGSYPPASYPPGSYPPVAATGYSALPAGSYPPAGSFPPPPGGFPPPAAAPMGYTPYPIPGYGGYLGGAYGSPYQSSHSSKYESEYDKYRDKYREAYSRSARSSKSDSRDPYSRSDRRPRSRSRERDYYSKSTSRDSKSDYPSSREPSSRERYPSVSSKHPVYAVPPPAGYPMYPYPTAQPTAPAGYDGGRAVPSSTERDPARTSPGAVPYDASSAPAPPSGFRSASGYPPPPQGSQYSYGASR